MQTSRTSRLTSAAAANAHGLLRKWQRAAKEMVRRERETLGEATDAAR